MRRSRAAALAEGQVVQGYNVFRPMSGRGFSLLSSFARAAHFLVCFDPRFMYNIYIIYIY